MRLLLLGVLIGFVVSTLVVVVPMVLAQGAPPLQELIPLPGPGQPLPVPGPAPQQGQDQCPILLYQNGQLYQLTPAPGPGPRDGQGRPGSPPEFFYLNPYQGPAIPGLPQPLPQRPEGPNFQPALPRS